MDSVFMCDCMNDFYLSVLSYLLYVIENSVEFLIF